MLKIRRVSVVVAAICALFVVAATGAMTSVARADTYVLIGSNGSCSNPTQVYDGSFEFYSNGYWYYYDQYEISVSSNGGCIQDIHRMWYRALPGASSWTYIGYTDSQ
jgi:hypothetical protein